MNLLVLLLLIYVVAFIFLFNRHSREHFDEESRTFGLVLRSQVPKKLQAKLNSFDPAPILPAIQKLPELPKNFDAREKWPGLITGPLDQEQCGSCWAFSLALACSDRLRIANPHEPVLTKKITYGYKKGNFEELNNFDPWHLAACNLCSQSPLASDLKDAGLCDEQACGGQVLQVAMQYIYKNGLITMDCDPHDRECPNDREKCNYRCETNECKKYKPKYFFHFGHDLADKLGIDRSKFNQHALMNDGPLVVGFEVWQSFMEFYKDPKNAKKVYTKKIKDSYKNDKKVSGHAVTLIGWGTDDSGMDYWLVRNSWGRDWADGGFFRIERGRNFLGIGDDVWSSNWAGQECKTCVDVLLPTIDKDPENAALYS